MLLPASGHGYEEGGRGLRLTQRHRDGVEAADKSAFSQRLKRKIRYYFSVQGRRPPLYPLCLRVRRNPAPSLADFFSHRKTGIDEQGTGSIAAEVIQEGLRRFGVFGAFNHCRGVDDGRVAALRRFGDNLHAIS